jgi:hypothetical protein
LEDPLARKRRRVATVVVSVLGLALVAVALNAVLGNSPAGNEATASTETAFDPPKTAPEPTSGPSAVLPGDATGTTPSTDPAGGAVTSAPAPSPREITVVLTYGGYTPDTDGVLAGGYADAVTENDGTCTLTLEQDGLTRSASQAATPDAATTSCGELTIPRTELSSGTWQATLSYQSPLAYGTSSSMPIEVP